MPDLSLETQAPAQPARKTSDLIRQWKEAGQPIVLTLNGQAQLLVQDKASFRALVELVERVEEAESLRISVENMKAGHVVPIEELFAEMEQILNDRKAR